MASMRVMAFGVPLAATRLLVHGWESAVLEVVQMLAGRSVHLLPTVSETLSTAFRLSADSRHPTVLEALREVVCRPVGNLTTYYRLRSTSMVPRLHLIK